jgi:type IV pilus assembly protein PilQ
VRLGASNKTAVAGSGKLNLGIGGNYSGVTAAPTQDLTGSAASLANSYFVQLPASAINGYNAASMGISLFTSSVNHALNLELSALEADGKGKIVSSPRVITADQIKALIEQGTELPYQQSAPNGGTTTSFRKANLKLEVTPQITPDGSIILDVDVNKDSVGQVTNAGYAIDTKHVQTQVLVENGGTVVIGGIFQQQENETTQKVPFLGDIPYLGVLFKNNIRNSKRSELLIFLTPKVVTEKAALR